MSNVCAPAVLRTICRAQSRQVFPARHLFCGFRRVRTHQERSSTLIHRESITDLTRRAFASKSGARADIFQTQKNVDESFGLPGANLRDSTTSATHKEGVQDAENWRNYDPEGGLPLPDGELGKSEIDSIFGINKVSKDTGNYILCVMNWRRMSGALIDVGIKFPRTSDVTADQAFRGLSFLRQLYPDVDEESLGAQWAEEEAQRLRQQLQDRAVKLGLYKPLDAEEKEALEEEQEQEEIEDEGKQGTAYGRARSGTSMLEQLRAANREKNDLEERQAVIRVAQKERSLLAAARGPLELAGGLQQQVGVKRYGTMDVVLRQPTSSASLARSEPPAWVKHYQNAAQIIKDEVVPEMSTFRRLAPSALVFLLVISGCYYLGTHYTPPPVDARLFPSVPPSVATLSVLTVTLVGMFVAGKVPPFWRTLSKYFTLVPAYPYPVSIVGAIFRHDKFTHLLGNTLGLWAIGLTLHEDVGRGWFLATFLGCGATGTMAALTYGVLTRSWSTYIFGASGAVYGILSALCVLRPSGTVHILGVEVPFAAWGLLTGITLIQARGVFAGALENTDYLGHFFGILSGAVSALGLRAYFVKDKRVAQALREETT